jgi:hypothetical protein
VIWIMSWTGPRAARCTGAVHLVRCLPATHSRRF